MFCYQFWVCQECMYMLIEKVQFHLQHFTECNNHLFCLCIIRWPKIFRAPSQLSSYNSYYLWNHLFCSYDLTVMQRLATCTYTVCVYCGIYVLYIHLHVYVCTYMLVMCNVSIFNIMIQYWQFSKPGFYNFIPKNNYSKSTTKQDFYKPFNHFFQISWYSIVSWYFWHQYTILFFSHITHPYYMYTNDTLFVKII